MECILEWSVESFVETEDDMNEIVAGVQEFIEKVVVWTLGV